MRGRFWADGFDRDAQALGQPDVDGVGQKDRHRLAEHRRLRLDAAPPQPSHRSRRTRPSLSQTTRANHSGLVLWRIPSPGGTTPSRWNAETATILGRRAIELPPREFGARLALTCALVDAGNVLGARDEIAQTRRLLPGVSICPIARNVATPVRDRVLEALGARA